VCLGSRDGRTQETERTGPCGLSLQAFFFLAMVQASAGHALPQASLFDKGLFELPKLFCPAGSLPP